MEIFALLTKILQSTLSIFMWHISFFLTYLFTNLLELKERTDVNKMAQPVKVLAAKSDNWVWSLEPTQEENTGCHKLSPDLHKQQIHTCAHAHTHKCNRNFF